jgi:hypothetical protein
VVSLWSAVEPRTRREACTFKFSSGGQFNLETGFFEEWLTLSDSGFDEFKSVPGGVASILL